MLFCFLKNNTDMLLITPILYYIKYREIENYIQTHILVYRYLQFPLELYLRN